ncbi:MAG TPA: PAS domain S-box protein, partial [Spirochaetes bacterium]|nr:PAS domain S-box protein [Spirochaetota bacterium]
YDLRKQVHQLERLNANHHLIHSIPTLNKEITESLFSSPMALIAELDVHFNLIRVNQDFANVHIPEPHFFGGQNFFDLYPGEENKIIFQRVLEKAQPFVTQHKPIKLTDPAGQWTTYWEGSIQPIKDSKDLVTGLFLNLLDRTDQKLSEDMLLKQAQIIDQINDSVISTDMDGFITHWNMGAKRLYGYTAREALTRHISFLYPNDFQDDFKKTAIKPLIDQGVNEIETHALGKSGKIFFVSLSFSLLKDETGSIQGLIAYSIDITRRKKAEKDLETHLDQLDDLVKQRTSQLTLSNQRLQNEIANHKQTEIALRESEETLKALLNASNEASFLLDTKGKVLGLNKNAGHKLKKDPNQLIGECIYDHIPSDLAEKRKSQLKQVIESKQSISFEDSQSGKEYAQTIYPVYSSEGKVDRIAIFAMDITERKKAERHLLHRLELEDIITSISTRFIKLSVDEIDDAIYQALKDISLFAKVDQCAIYLFNDDQSEMSMNCEWYRDSTHSMKGSLQNISTRRYPWIMTQLSLKEMILIPSVAELSSEADNIKSLYQSLGIQSILNVPMVYEKDLIGFIGVVCIRGKKSWTEDVIKLLRIVGEILTHALSRKKADQHQRYLFNVLESTNQELEDFAHIVSHELKRPLGTARLQLASLFADYKINLDEEGQKQIAQIISKLDILNGLINNILHYSSIGWVEEEIIEIDLNDIVAEALENISMPNHIQIIMENHLPNIWFEKTRILQIYQNLISNAVKYMGKPEGIIKIGSLDEKDLWKFWVSDNGQGIEQDNLHSIFKLFKTLNDNPESTGVGLALVKKITEMYEGEIWVESTIGEGSIFFFTLPK